MRPGCVNGRWREQRQGSRCWWTNSRGFLETRTGRSPVLQGEWEPTAACGQALEGTTVWVFWRPGPCSLGSLGAGPCRSPTGRGLGGPGAWAACAEVRATATVDTEPGVRTQAGGEGQPHLQNSHRHRGVLQDQTMRKETSQIAPLPW